MNRPPERNEDETWPNYLMRLGFVGVGGLLVYWFVDGVLSGMDEGGLLSFIPRLLAPLTAIVFMIMAAPSISNWAKNSGVPWVNEKLDAFGTWIKGALPQKQAALDESVTAPHAAPVRTGALPETSVKLSSVTYGGQLDADEIGGLPVQSRLTAQAEIAAKQAALSA